MDLSGFLRLVTTLILVGSSLLAGCRTTERPAEMDLPTVAITADAAALQSFVPIHTPPAQSPVPTLPTSTPYPTATPRLPSPTPSPTPEIVVTNTVNPQRQINGVPIDSIAFIPPAVAEHIHEIAALGRELDRNPKAFSKLGDSAVLTESNLTRFDTKPLNLGPYDYLQPTIEYFAGSWERYGAGARVSLTTIGTFDPMWANPSFCSAGEHLLACEVRLHNPSILLIRLGTNDGSAELYGRYMARIIQFAIDNGVVPILGTKADRFEGDDSINQTTRRLAAEYRVPLWDFDILAATLPNQGLTDDEAHLTVHGRNDYTDPETFTKGYPMSDLSALAVLDAVRRIMATEEE